MLMEPAETDETKTDAVLPAVKTEFVELGVMSISDATLR